MKYMYETIIIFTDTLSEKQYDRVVHEYKGKILKGEIKAETISVDKLGKKKLAYEIKGSKEGWYAIFKYATEPDKIPTVERFIRTDVNVLKFITVKTSDEDDEEYKEVDTGEELYSDSPTVEVDKSEQDDSDAGNPNSKIDAMDVMLGFADYVKVS